MAGTALAESVARIEARPSASPPASKVSATTWLVVGIRVHSIPSRLVIGLGARVGEVLGREVGAPLALTLEGAAAEVLGAGRAAAVVLGDEEDALALLSPTGELALVDGLLGGWACRTQPASGSSSTEARTAPSARRGPAARCGAGPRLIIAT